LTIWLSLPPRSRLLNSVTNTLNFTFALLLLLASAVTAQGRPPTNVIVNAVLRQPVEDELSIVGRTRPRRTGVLASETDGKVVAKVLQEGNRARKGAVILRLENNQLRAAYLEAKADLDLQQFNCKRTEELYKQDVVPEQSMNDARYQLARAQSKYNDLSDRVAKLRIRAPYPGYVVQVMSGVGEWVKRGDGVIRFISTDTMRVHVNVPENHIGSMHVGARADLYIDALGTDPMPGIISNVIPEAYAESHTFPVIVGTENKDGRIKSNMSARVVFQISESDSVTLVHKDAIVTSPRGHTVYVAVDGKAIPRSVQPGLAHNGYVAVTGDLKPGELAIVRGNERLRPDQDIKVIRQMQ
jgi:membrane fusion protein (multidrug efflux system)